MSGNETSTVLLLHISQRTCLEDTKASTAEGGYWMYKTIHSSSSHIRETSKRLNTKDKFHDNKMGEFDSPNLKSV